MFKEHVELDPNLTPQQLWQLASERQDLWPAILTHPNTYEELNSWIQSHQSGPFPQPFPEGDSGQGPVTGLVHALNKEGLTEPSQKRTSAWKIIAPVIAGVAALGLAGVAYVALTIDGGERPNAAGLGDTQEGSTEDTGPIETISPETEAVPESEPEAEPEPVLEPEPHPSDCPAGLPSYAHGTLHNGWISICGTAPDGLTYAAYTLDNGKTIRYTPEPDPHHIAPVHWNDQMDGLWISMDREYHLLLRDGEMVIMNVSNLDVVASHPIIEHHNIPTSRAMLEGS